MIIGVTGGMGSGKTTLAQEMSRMGAMVIDADRIAKKVINDEEEIQKKIQGAFGSDVFNEKRQLNRRLLAQRAFSSAAQCNRLNRIIWPRLIKRLRNEIDMIQKRSEDIFIILDMAVLFESGADVLVDRTVTVSAPKAVRITRVKQERNWSEKEITQRMRMQMAESEKRKRADIVIRNNGSLAQLKQKARDCFKTLSMELHN